MLQILCLNPVLSTPTIFALQGGVWEDLAVEINAQERKEQRQKQEDWEAGVGWAEGRHAEERQGGAGAGRGWAPGRVPTKRWTKEGGTGTRVQGPGKGRNMEVIQRLRREWLRLSYRFLRHRRHSKAMMRRMLDMMGDMRRSLRTDTGGDVGSSA